MPYRHTQFGTVILVVCLVIAVFGGAIAWRAQPAAAIPMLVILAAVAVFFHSLTVEIGDNELRWHFGPGLWTYWLPLNEIEWVAAVHNHWWNGFGIRTAPGFTLYNVSGLDAVELKLKSGGVKRIGTDDPAGLAAALQSAMRG
ncbi:MAG: hypothetical protein WAU79_21150 [Bradyrhizobium sp.]|uniref:hypothetical protein n=1 Tax=Bradyrhizobium sp. TaxID=376 RepID=UPI003BAF4963